MNECILSYRGHYRLLYQQINGSLSEDICVRHSCASINCINMNHLYMKAKKTPLRERFLKCVQIPENKNSCWGWLLAKDKNGYGNFKAKEINENRAHRVSYFLFKGDFDRKLQICHTCDNPQCVNPDHLWAGTSLQNTQDAFSKNRRKIIIPPIRYGEKNNKAKLNKQQVLQIRFLRMLGKKYHELSKIYKVSKEQISMICNNKNWKNI